MQLYRRTFVLNSFLILFGCTVVLSDSEEKCEDQSYREKRQVNGIPLIYPYGGTYKLLIGFATPIKAEDYISLVFAANFQYQYVQFMNISQLSKYYFVKDVGRQQREVDLMRWREERLVFYRSFANLLDIEGFNGEQCVLRAICEAAQYPVLEEGLVGEIIHILLTPDYGHSPFDDDEDWKQMMSSYIDAATAGRQMFSCEAIYYGCPGGQGVMELISTLEDF